MIGTGNMGAPMSINLSRAGFTVHAFDIVAEKMSPLEPHGVRACNDHADAIAGADMVLTMLPAAR